MNYAQLKDFITNQMKMTHIYQPVMLIELLKNSGTATRDQIAKSILSHDRSQIEYYEHITLNMVGKVLTNNRGITERNKRDYFLKGFDNLSQEQITELIKLCEHKIEAFKEARGDKIWSHRKKSSGYISGTLRYDILKNAKFRCELCGISAEQKALEVDHIVPRKHGGSDEKSNLQALCYSCNAMKRDRDDTDFREVKDRYQARQDGCIFCELPRDRIVEENELAYAIRDAFPVTDLHTLIIPKRHVSDYFKLYQPERNAVQQLLESQRVALMNEDPLISGFNIGNNVGETAGQTVMHCHTHLIPRRFGDVENPAGGIRGVIADKQKY
jgi:ATP adenylyltransferase